MSHKRLKKNYLLQDTQVLERDLQLPGTACFQSILHFSNPRHILLIFIL